MIQPAARTGERPEDEGLTAYPSVQKLNGVQAAHRAALLEKLAAGTYRLERVASCLCGSRNATEVAAHDRFGIPVGVVVCSSCGLARTSPRLAAVHLPRFYEEDYHGLHIGVPEPHPSTALYRVGQGARIYELVSDQLSAGPIRVAEVGCGTGQVLREFVAAATDAGHSIAAVGCEYASAYAEAGRAVGTDIRVGGPATLAAEGPFDLLILSHVLEHFANVEAELATIASLVRPGSHVYVEVPGILAIHHKPEYDYEFARYLTLAHTYHFSLDTLTDAMARAGFELVRGDEEARTVFRRIAEPIQRPVARGDDRVSRYLAWLASSRSTRLRRMALRSRRAARSAIRSSASAVLGPRLYRVLRDAAKRVHESAKDP